MEVIIIVPYIGIESGRSCRVDGILWTIEITCVWLCTFGTRTNVVDFGFTGT